MLVCNFYRCTDYVKITLFLETVVLYFMHLQYTITKRQVAYNYLGFLDGTSARQMLVTGNVSYVNVCVL